MNENVQFEAAAAFVQLQENEQWNSYQEEDLDAVQAPPRLESETKLNNNYPIFLSVVDCTDHAAFEKMTSFPAAILHSIW